MGLPHQYLKQHGSGITFCGFVVVVSLWLGCNQANNSSRRAEFVSPDFNVPVLLEHANFKLRPIRQTDAQLDYEAVMSSAKRLQIQFDGSWPADDFSIEENRNQLGIHEEQFFDRMAFVYTVLRPDESQVLGCVYIYPDETKQVDAIVTYWVRETETIDELQRELDSTLKNWLQNEWPFQTVKFDRPQ